MPIYPSAYVVLKEGETASAEEILDDINPKVAGYEKTREVVFRKELPVSLTGKVLTRAVPATQVCSISS